MKKTICAFLFFIILFAVFGLSGTASAAEVVDEGICGENLTWVLDDEGTLTVSGEGEMNDYESSGNAPWVAYKSDICSVVIEEGVTTIGNYAFRGCYKVENISLADGILSIGSGAFWGIGYVEFFLIPDSVTTVGWSAFRAMTSLVEISLTDNITELPDCLLADCTVLQSVYIAEKVKKIGDSAFFNCHALLEIIVDAENEYFCDLDGVLYSKDCSKIIKYPSGRDDTSFVIPDGVININVEAFDGNDFLESVIIPDTVEKIGRYAFSSCDGLLQIRIPASVKELGSEFVWSCASLTEVVVDEANEYYCTVDNVLYDEQQEQLLFYLPAKKDTSFTVPDTVKSISLRAFYDCAFLENITIPAGVVTIGNDAFYSCSALLRVVLPDTVESIGQDAFRACQSLQYVTILNGNCNICDLLTTIPTNASVYGYPDSTAQLYADTYTRSFVALVDDGTCGDRLLWYLDAENVLTISGCGSMKSFMEDEQPWVDYRESITELVVANGVSSIGTRAFMNCSMITTADIADSVERIDEYAFMGCVNLQELQLPANLTTFGMYALYDCDSLTTLHLPATVSSIRYSALSACDHLQEITVDENNQTYISQDGILYNKGMQKLIVYPAGKEDLAYTMPESVIGAFPYAFTGVRFLEEVVFAPTSTAVSSSVFQDAGSIVTVTLPETITYIDSYAFYGCTALQNINIPSGVTKINKEAFRNCKALTTIALPDLLTTIGDYAFSGCSALEQVSLNPESCLQKIGEYAFNCCTMLKEIRIPDAVSEIKEGTFSACYSLARVIFSDKCELEIIGNSAFVCTALTSIHIPDSVHTIGALAFADPLQIAKVLMSFVTLTGNENPLSDIEYTSSLKSVTFGTASQLKNIGAEAFYKCVSLTDFAIPSGVTSINKSTFAGCSALSEFVIPETVTSIAEKSFADCTSLFAVAVVNPDCEIAEDAFEETVTLYGYPDSSAQVYAETYGCSFTAFCDGIAWSFSDDVLHIGTADEISVIPDSETRCYFPWVACGRTTDAVVLENVSSVGNNAFADFAQMTILVVYGDSGYLAAASFADCPNLHSVVSFADLTAEPDAFIGKSDALLFYAEQGKAVDGLDSVVTFSLEEDAVIGNTVFFAQPVTLGSYDLFNLVIAVCDVYNPVYAIRFASVETTDLIFYRTTQTGEAENLNFIADAVFTVAVIDYFTEDGMKTISFNELCDGVADGAIESFVLRVNDAENSDYEDIPIGTENTDLVSFWLRAITSLINKLLRYLRGR